MTVATTKKKKAKTDLEIATEMKEKYFELPSGIYTAQEIRVGYFHCASSYFNAKLLPRLPFLERQNSREQKRFNLDTIKQWARDHNAVPKSSM